ncbi:MAG: type II secretion system ATPase GspE [Candidatus Aureabacteria bacterium]|nr:type II secretion system ATPase GspE [Candidatus Auribacterota bacterium]
MPYMKRNTRLGQILLKAGIIDENQLQKALDGFKSSGQRLGHVLVELGFSKEEDVLKAVADQLDVPYIKLSDIEIDRAVIAKIPVKFTSRYKLIPFKMANDTLTVAMLDPLDIHTLDDLRLLLGCKVTVAISSEEEITKAIRKYYGVGAETMEKMVEAAEDENDLESLEISAEKDVDEMAEDASVIKFVNQIVIEAYNDRATDIHFEPFENELRIRYRIDGVLYEITAPHTIARFQSAIVSRIKIMADLNIAEKRLPQDGRIKLNLSNQEIDLRVAIIPTLFGESMNIRILPKGKIVLGLEQLGLVDANLARILSLIQKPHGIVLVTGPTGSGKTTTLYASLNKINSADKKIITIEDPIEYQLRGVTQIQVRPKIDLTFANGLRSILRMDPDVIMVGEMRDFETAEIAIRASLTGHLVFSTLHTNDAPGAVTRLVDMGIEPFLVSSSIEAVLAQRLVRVLCPKCKTAYTPEENLLKEIGLNKAIENKEAGETTLYKARGCEECMQTGYKGRTGIYELVLVDDEIRKLVLERTSTDVIKQKAIASGMMTLRQYGWSKVLAGVTSVDEILRVTEA